MTLSRRLALFFLTALPASGALAQEVYGPTDFSMESQSDQPVPLVEPEPCEEEVREDGAIVVCRELPDSERYLSPLPKPVEVHINQLDGLREPPCWVTGKWPCMRFGGVPPYPPLIDTSAYPEALSAEELAAIRVVPDEEADSAEPRVGERVAIDISETD